MPLLYVRKEVFQWLREGEKTIDVRKGNSFHGNIAVFQCGPRVLRFKIEKRESGQLLEILRLDNFREVIPTAFELDNAVRYLQRIYGNYDGVFTAYYIAPLE